MSVGRAKQKIREEVLQLRDNLSKYDQERKSCKICEQLFSLPVLKKSHVIFVYNHFRSEVQTAQILSFLLSCRKNICVPYVMVDQHEMIAVEIQDPKTQLTPGYMNILEPKKEVIANHIVAPENIDIALVPGVVFDHLGGRIGYGGGFYDRFLRQKASRATKIGLAFTVQLVQAVELEMHDVSMDIVVTEDKIYSCFDGKKRLSDEAYEFKDFNS